MSLSILPASLAHSRAHTGQDSFEDINSYLEIDDIFASVFSAFDDEEEEVRDMTMMPDWGLQIQSPHPATSHPYSGHYAVAVSPTSSCVELATSYQADDAHSFEHTPFADILPIVPEYSAIDSPRAISPVQRLAEASRPTKKRRGQSSTSITQVTSAETEVRQRKTPVQRSSPVQEEESPDSLEATRQRNREHARKSRMRKKVLTTGLQSALDELKAENQKLRGLIMGKIEQKRAESLIEMAKAPPPVEQFITALKQPQNRVVDGNTLKFLEGLRKEALAASQLSSSKDDEELEAFLMVG